MDTFHVLIEQVSTGRSRVSSAGCIVAERVGQAIVGAVAESLFVDTEGQSVEATCHSAWSVSQLRPRNRGVVPGIKIVHSGSAPPRPLTLLTFDRTRIHTIENPWVLANDMADRIGDVLEGTRYFKGQPGNMLHDTYMSGGHMISHLELLGRVARTAEQMRPPAWSEDLAAEIIRLGDVAAFSVTGYNGAATPCVPQLDFAPRPAVIV